MKSSLNFVKTTIIGGIVFLIPFAIVVYVIQQIYSTLYEVVSPLLTSLGIQSIAGGIITVIVIILLILLISFTAGLIVKMSFAKRTGAFFENLALRYIPGYNKLRADVLKNVNKKLAQDETNFYDKWQAVIIKDNAGWKIAFIVEETKENIITIFEPHSADLLKGAVKMISKEDIKSIPIENDKAISYLKNYGIGASELLAKSKT
jgi:uncharacterized membrane protein